MGWLRLDVVKLLLLAIPTLLINQLLLGITVPVTELPWSAAAVLLPLAAGVAVAWRFLRRDRPVALGHGYLAFFLAYCLLFSIATGSDLLTGQRQLLSGYEEELPRNFLALNRFGDWHYAVLPPAPPAQDLVVVTFPSFAGEVREELRRHFAFLIQQAVEHGAKGLAFDYFFEESSKVDPLIRMLLAGAEQQDVPVIFGFRHDQREGLIVRRPLVESLAEAVPPQRQGHLSGYLELDGRVRMVPVELPGVGGLESLSYRVATVLTGGEVTVPASRLVQFNRPRDDIPVLPFSPDLDWELLRDRVVLVGTAAEHDARQTPFGEVQGVVIHAWAAHSLRGGHLIERLDERWTFPAIFALCYLLTVLQARGAGSRKLLLAAAALSLAVLSAAVLAMRWGQLWVDVSYPLVALWLLVLLLLAGGAVRTVWTPPAASPEAAAPAAAAPEAAPAAAADGEGFDVFLSHNSQDKPRVREIGTALKARGLRPWLDEWELIPGRPWQEALEDILRTVGSSAILVGQDGLGPWEVPEMRASLSECVRRGLPVIPVLLPGAPQCPELPLFLTQYTWVDLRGGLTAAGLDRLQWGITGIKPASVG